MGKDMSMYPVGILIGIAIGIGVGSGMKEEVEVPMQPTAIVYEDRNADRLPDLVQQYKDGSEIVLYASRNEQGGIEFKLQE